MSVKCQQQTSVCTTKSPGNAGASSQGEPLGSVLRDDRAVEVIVQAYARDHPTVLMASRENGVRRAAGPARGKRARGVLSMVTESIIECFSLG
jgi:hypothetical protein